MAFDNFHHPPAADRTFTHHNQFRLVGGGPDQPPGAIGKTEAHAIDRDQGSDRLDTAKMIGHPLHDFIFDSSAQWADMVGVPQVCGSSR